MNTFRQAKVEVDGITIAIISLRDRAAKEVDETNYLRQLLEYRRIPYDNTFTNTQEPISLLVREAGNPSSHAIRKD